MNHHVGSHHKSVKDRNRRDYCVEYECADRRFY